MRPLSPFLFFIWTVMQMTGRSGERTKFNVSRDVEQRTCDGIVFDSKLEMRYYRDVILPLVRSGEIEGYELQRPYLLQPEFTRGGKKIRAVVYVADFYVRYADGHEEVIDTKGFADSVAKMKRKLFWYKYPNVEYRWLTYVKKHGGWVDYDEVARKRRAAKREKQMDERK